ncbi:hypothetical protein EK21DRAFT_119251 [Setomelanomma holmii]|uniref:Uncharacterized protein n=1 Tax=Setomelanomma holmii TaxID=210430 RepID=A0A9P4LF98_9PLEO|nr:hypothetical protein EK21DRAFT_119251 [Setomelanomma holmii]
MANYEELKLFVIDQTIYRMYLRHLLVSPFPGESVANNALRALCTGLASTIQDYPVLAGTLQVPNPSTGIIKAKHPENIDVDLVYSRFDVGYALFGVFDYEVMKAKGFPPTMLPGHVFCPSMLRKHLGLNDAYAEKPADAAKGQPSQS